MTVIVALAVENEGGGNCCQRRHHHHHRDYYHCLRQKPMSWLVPVVVAPPPVHGAAVGADETMILESEYRNVLSTKKMQLPNNQMACCMILTTISACCYIWSGVGCVVVACVGSVSVNVADWSRWTNANG